MTPKARTATGKSVRFTSPIEAGPSGPKNGESEGEELGAPAAAAVEEEEEPHTAQGEGAAELESEGRDEPLPKGVLAEEDDWVPLMFGAWVW
ncbi:hypothetical protein JCM9279_005310 [Rhodotorula babjevae]